MRTTSPILVALSLAAWCVAASPASAQSSADTQACLKCHVKPSEAVTDRRIFHQDLWEAGVHATLDCTTCHLGEDPKAFDQLPHRLGDSPPLCMECHDPDLRGGLKPISNVKAVQEALARRDDDFSEINEDFQRSVHAARLDAFSPKSRGSCRHRNHFE
jgi:hypothetical protein